MQYLASGRNKKTFACRLAADYLKAMQSASQGDNPIRDKYKISKSKRSGQAFPQQKGTQTHQYHGRGFGNDPDVVQHRPGIGTTYCLIVIETKEEFVSGFGAGNIQRNNGKNFVDGAQGDIGCRIKEGDADRTVNIDCIAQNKRAVAGKDRHSYAITPTCADVIGATSIEANRHRRPAAG